MNTATDAEKVQQIAEAAGLSVQHMTPLGRGATSTAWRIITLHDAFIVRYVPAGTPRPVTYQSEFTILRLLRQAGCPVPEPVLSSVELTVPLPAVPEPWAITHVVPGQAIQHQALSPTVAEELGHVLSILHALPAQGFGRLVEQPGVLAGRQQDPVSGVRARWCWADLWPFDGTALSHHPITQNTARLRKKLEAIEAEIVDCAKEQPVCLTHSDLHGDHIFVRAGLLSGIIDFGAAFIGAPAWDFAVLSFYHGWPAVQAALSCYCPLMQRQQFFHHIQLLAVVVGLYKLARVVKAQAPAPKVAHIEQFVARTLAEMP